MPRARTRRPGGTISVVGYFGEEDYVKIPRREWAWVGTVIAVVPASRTLVVDVLLDRDVLRIGTEVTSTTTITADGQALSLNRLQAGDRVRISVRRVGTGNEAIVVEVLQ